MRDESSRFPPVWSGFESRTRCHKWIEFVVGSRPCSDGFSSGSLVFLSPQKPAFNSDSIWERMDQEPSCGDATPSCHFSYFLFVI